MEKFPQSETIESEDALYGAVAEAQGRMSELLAARPAETEDLESYAKQLEEANRSETEALKRWLEHVRREASR
jgi:hypothetical protein